MLVFDIETNGLLHELDRVHCMVIKDTETGEVTRYNDQRGEGDHRPNISQGVSRLVYATMAGTIIAGHNVVKFDVPALKKVYPWFSVDERFVLDTIVLSRLAYPDLWDIDARLKKTKGFPGQLTNRHSLEAWGRRLGVFKGDYTGGWAAWSQEMEDYNVQDVEVTHALLTFLTKDCKVPPPQQAIDLEMAVAWIVARQERYGFYFDQERAAALYVKLSKRRLELEAKLKASFKPFYVPHERPMTPKRDNKKQGYTAGAVVQKVKLVEFNPSSRDHVANRLTRLYGWKPTQFTPDGKPQVDEGVLRGLKFPEAALLDEYFTVQKRIGQLAEGKEACLRHVSSVDSRMRGGVITNGAVTGRMSHARPNVAQTPAGYSPYGEEFRACYRATPGADKELVGADAAALEARCLAHYMALYDAGAYVQTVIAGRKEDGTDVHSVTMRAIEITSRDDAKTWYYAFLYGAGDEKLGFTILKERSPAKCRKRGKQSKESIERNLPALGELIKAVRGKAKTGYLRGLDGRWLLVRSQHAALNTLLQSCGAVLMKRALVILDTTLQQEGYVPGVNYEFVANVHDEWQIECDAGLGVRIGELAVASIRAAGESFAFRCPLDGEAVVGASWADTH